MKRFVTVAGTALMAIGLVACGGSPTAPSGVAGISLSGGSQLASNHTPTLTSSDADFVNFAATSYQSLIQTGTIAEARSAHPRVKWFARQMVSEPRARLVRLRSEMGGNVSQNISVSASQTVLLGQLSNTAALQLDRVYTQAMLPELEAMLSRFQQAGRTASDAVLRAHATDFADRLVQYLEDLREIANRVQ
jgi:predicted outer membrane protein